MGSLPDVSELRTRLENSLTGYHNLEETEWRVAKKTTDVTVWRKPSTEFSGFLYKVQGLVMEEPNRIVEYIRPGPYRLQWDSLMTSMDIVKTIDKASCVMRYMTAGQLWNLVAPREFVDFSYTMDFQNGLLSCGVSVDYEEQGRDSVRGFNHPCGWFCVPVDGETHSAPCSLLSGYIQTDLRGKIPQSAVDVAMANTLVTFYSDLRRALAT
ncbi:stAR-related lipid transfer protein 4 [Trichomycterus rosablanca]|uniref:stAR-related lipid transfer protein 4 n=1 Tax=Trichomycterus rosablanca TaxID=2290929 RepID=UPI002F35A5B4